MKKYLFFTFIFICSVSFGQVDLQNGLISSYPFNGNPNDESGNGNDGVVYGATLTTDRFGNENEAYFFDGSSSYIAIDPVSDVSQINDFTISVWANCFSWEVQSDMPDNLLDHQYIFDGQTHSESVSSDYFRDGFLVNYKLKTDLSEYVVNSTRDLESRSFINDINYTNEILQNWNHIVFIRSSSVTKHYINGELVEILDNNTYPLNMQHKWFIGTFSGNNPNYYAYNSVNYNFHGKIDDIKIYNRALNEKEVISLFFEDDYKIWTNSIDTLVNYDLSIPVNTLNLAKDRNISAYQFDLSYDTLVLEFTDVDITGTISENGTVNVNSSSKGLLKISYMTSDTLSGEGELLFLNFRSIGRGSGDIMISDFLFNTDTVKNIINSTITVAEIYGDVDGNNEVQAYDASLVLKNSVGLDPLPENDPLPWENWRVYSADVDKSNDLTAMDASYILQYSTGSITEFPVYASKKSSSANLVDIRVEENHINFYASNELSALNVFIDNLSSIELGEPVILNKNFINARNINDLQYNLGLATAYEPEEGEKILEIPFYAPENTTLSLDLIVNTEYKNVSVDIKSTTGISDYKADKIQVFPNPVNNTLRIKGLKSNCDISVYSFVGKQLRYWKSVPPEQEVDISDLKSGAYLLKVITKQDEFYQKIIKR